MINEKRTEEDYPVKDAGRGRCYCIWRLKNITQEKRDNKKLSAVEDSCRNLLEKDER